MRRMMAFLGMMVVVLAAAGRPAAALDGRALYARHCERCHGPNGRGDGRDAELFATRPRDLRTGFLAHYSTDDLVRRLRSGVPLELALDLPALRARATEVEALAAHLERLPKVDWRRVEEGQAVWLDRCEICHGPTGAPGAATPKRGHPPRDLSDPAWQRATTDGALAEVVRHGRRGMPALDPPVSAGDARALIAFVRLLSPGFTLYDRYCAACHGDDGRGSGSFAEEGRPPAVVFDRSYFTRRDPEQVRTAIWHMLVTARPEMPHFRKKLIDAEARAIIEYLRQSD